MTANHHYLAIDLGAESGRAIRVSLADGRVSMDELHRWPNRRVNLAGTVHWDLPFLFAEIIEGIRACLRSGPMPESIAVDTWGVDFGLLDNRGKLLGLPVSYRDGRTDGIHDYTDPIMPREEIFRRTGYEPWQIASLFQLASLRRDGSTVLDAAETFLNTPDLLNYFLSGRCASERSIANNTNLMGTDGQWDLQIARAFDLPERLFGELIEAGTVLGDLRSDLVEEIGLDGALPVVAVCGHDTSSVVASVPAEGSDWAFLSCGTWSIIGSTVESPVTTDDCLARGFTNEYAIGEWYLARNILGLWLVQELRRKWDTPEDPWDYVRMTDEARAVSTDALLDVSDDRLRAPDDMERAILDVLADHGQPAPADRGEMVRCVLQSLALEYDWRLRMLGDLTGRTYTQLNIVGGGIANTLLCQLTADALGLPVHAGADQCTALGNALTQALALGHIDSKEHIREIMRNSTDMTVYHPAGETHWADWRKRYDEMQK